MALAVRAVFGRSHGGEVAEGGGDVSETKAFYPPRNEAERRALAIALSSRSGIVEYDLTICRPPTRADLVRAATSGIPEIDPIRGGAIT